MLTWKLSLLSIINGAFETISNIWQRITIIQSIVEFNKIKETTFDWRSNLMLPNLN